MGFHRRAVFFFFYPLACLSTQHGTNRHSASHSALQLAENHGKNIDKQRWNNSRLACAKPSVEVKCYYHPGDAFRQVEARSAKQTLLCPWNTSNKSRCKCLFVQTLIKSPYRPFMWVLLLEPELKRCRVLHPRPHSSPGSVGSGAAAHSFMSEPGTGTAATTKAEKLHHPANAHLSWAGCWVKEMARGIKTRRKKTRRRSARIVPLSFLSGFLSLPYLQFPRSLSF